MKAKKTSSDKMAVIKAGFLFSWVLLLFVANSQDIIIEAFLFTIIISITSYFLFDNRSFKSTKIEGNHVIRSQSNRGPQGEQYLKVFFSDPS